ncbi:MAG: Uma2 family endonuclease [Elainellaceae cyanobacterium]
MTTFPPHIEQTDPPRPAAETLPTMYDLPSEDSEEPGLPDEFHYLQPQLLSATFRLASYAQDNVFTAGDLNLYYDVRHPLWYKRPDWFAVVGVSRLYRQREMRLSYVLWQEGVSPSVIVELLSPGTEGEDLGRIQGQPQQPPTKWQVYEQILRVPYYVVFDRYTDELRAFTLVSGSYQPVEIVGDRLWMPSLNIGLGLWQGTYEGITRQWLRWYDEEGNWILTAAERVQQELVQERAAREAAEQRAAELAERLRELEGR